MADFIDEVNQELRQERFMNFWRLLGGYIISVSIAVVAITVAVVLWQGYQEKQRIKASEHYFAGVAAKDRKDWAVAIEEFKKVAEENAPGVAAIAAMEEAQSLRMKGDLAAADARYVAIAADSSVEAGLRDLATLYAAQIRMDEGKDRATIDALLAPLVKKSSAFTASAKELMLYNALGANDVEAARTLATEISSDANAPSGVRVRAAALLGTLKSEPATPVKTE